MLSWALHRADPMTALETAERTTAPAEDAVFVARDGRRARRLRNAAVVVGVLAILWVVGLGVGMLGFGSMPGIALVKGVRHDSRPATNSAVPAAERDASRLVAAKVAAIRREITRSTASHDPAPVIVAKRTAVVRSAAPAPAATPAAATAQTPVNPATRTRGWSRKGYTAPRGLLRRTAPPPPPATSRGRRVGPQKTVALPPPVAPGQMKKAAQPPPPPPPPQKKG